MKKATFSLDFAFFEYLRTFYIENRGRSRSRYRDLTKKYLDFNDPDENRGAFLREPQFEALEMYVFLKEYLDNRHVHQIFEDWHKRRNSFERRSNIGTTQLGLFGNLEVEQYQAFFEYIKSVGVQHYPSYIFALAMGTGKTILMATCIFYEFLLANKWPKDTKYCHNALVFAPDKTVLQSLREIETFEMEQVVPPEYVNRLRSNLTFHFLDESGMALSTLDDSQFNIIISNTQKIILKRQHKEQSATDKLFKSGKLTYQAGTPYEQFSDLYEDELAENETELTVNQRFQKLTRLRQLGIYVDEAHHAFGSTLERDMGVKKTKTSLRLTIDELAKNLERAGTHVVGCYNFTGTPYVGNRVLPEVVYSYGLREAIDKGFLKKVTLHTYTNPKSSEFVRFVIEAFL